MWINHDVALFSRGRVRVDMTQPSHSDNPATRIVAHNTSQAQPDTIPPQRVKLHATATSLDVDEVAELLEEAVDAGELERVDDGYRTAE